MNLPQLTIRDIESKTLKSVDAWWVVFVIDPFAVRIVWLMHRFGRLPSPNTITFVSFIFGMISVGFLVFFESRESLLVAIFAYQISFLFDCIDGKIARLTETSSSRGKFYDSLVNSTVDILNIIALSYRFRQDENIFILGLILVGIIGIQNFLNQYTVRPEAVVWSPFVPGDRSRLRRHRLLAPMTGPDRMAVLFFICPLIGNVFLGFLIVVLVQFVVFGAKLRSILRSIV